MNGPDYYGRLMRRATARAESADAVAFDPFDSTAPWPLTDQSPDSGAQPSRDRPLAPVSTSPAPLMMPAASPAARVSAPLDVNDFIPPPDVQPLVERDQTVPPSSEPSSIEPSVAPSMRPVTELRPLQHASAPIVHAHDVRTPRPVYAEDDAQPAPEPARFDVESRPAVVAIPHERPPAQTPLAPASGRPRPAMLQPAAPAPRMPIDPPPEQGAPAPMISIGEIEIEIDQRAPVAAPAPAAPPRERAWGIRREGGVDPDLLRGPNDRAFGIGQV